MSGHAPGPWVVAPGDVEVECPVCGDTYIETESAAVIRGPSGGGVCVVLVDDRDEANARLIAASPDLLAASKAQEYAERIVSAFHQGEALAEARRLRRAAIAAAEGRP